MAFRTMEAVARGCDYALWYGWEVTAAGVAELADARVLEARGETRTGSIPVARIEKIQNRKVLRLSVWAHTLANSVCMPREVSHE